MGFPLKFFDGLTYNVPKGDYEDISADSSGERLIVEYDNGYGASIIRNRMSYGYPDKWELAVTHGERALCYATPITRDVLGWMTADGIISTLHEIAALSPNLDCDHEKPSDWDPFGDEDDPHSASFLDAMRSMGKGY